MDVRLPNGVLVRGVPDDLGQPELARIAVENGLAAKSDFPGLFDDVTLMGRIGETAKGVPRGFLSSLATGAEGLGALADAATNKIGLDNLIDSGDDNELIRLARAGQEKIDESLGADPAYRDLWSTKFGDAIGSLASFLVPGGAVKALGNLGKAAKTAEGAAKIGKAEMLATTPLALGVGAGEQSQRIQAARDAGLNVGQSESDLATITGGLIGLTELAPVSSILKGLRYEDLYDVTTGAAKPFAKTWLPRIKSAVASGSVEGIQEVASELMQDATEKNLYNPDLPIGQSAWDSFTLGGAAGFTADLLYNAIGGRRARGLTEQERAREEQNRVIEAEIAAESAAEFDPDNVQPIALLPPPDVDPNIKNPTEQVVDLARRYDRSMGPDFPMTQFTSLVNDQPSTQVVDGKGNPFGPTFATPEQAAQFAGAMNERVAERAVRFQADMAVAQTNEDYSPADRISMRLIGRRLFHPDHNVITDHELNYAAGTTAENGFQHEAMTLEEALAAGVKPSELTAAQKLNLQRRKSQRPEVRKFSTAEARKALGNDFSKLADVRITPAGANESFKVETRDGKPVVVSSYGEVIRDRRTTAKERADSRQDRMPFPSKKDAAAYAQYLNSRVKTGTFLRGDLKPDAAVSVDDIRNILAQKNITSDINSEAVRVLAERVTGIPARGNTKISDMSAAEKALIYYKLRSLPTLTQPSKLPVFRPRPYSPEQYRAARKAAIARAANINTPLTKKELPSKEDIESASGKLTEGGYKTLQADLIRDETVKAEIARNRAARAEAPEVVQEQKKEQYQASQAVTKAVRGVLNQYRLPKLGLTLTDYARKARLDENGDVVEGSVLDADPKKRDTKYGGFRHSMNRVFLHLEALKSNPDYVDAQKNGATEAQLEEILIHHAVETLNHEVLHAMRKADLFTEQEWELLERTAKVRKRTDNNTHMTYVQYAAQAYAGSSPVKIMEEAVAELIRDGLAGRLDIGGKQKSLMNRVVDFFRALLRLNGSGYRTVDDIVDAIQTGKIGAREQGVIRTMRATERLSGIAPRRGLVEPIGGDTSRPDKSVTAAKPLPGQSKADFDPNMVPDDENAMRVLSGVPGGKAMQKKAQLSDVAFSQRLQRAEEQGFDTSQVWYHGTRTPKPIKRFRNYDPVPVFVTADPKFASNFANSSEFSGPEPGSIYPLFIRVKNTFNPKSRADVERVYNKVKGSGQYGRFEDGLRIMESLKQAHDADVVDGITWDMYEDAAPLLRALGYDSYVDYEFANQPSTGLAIFDRDNVKGIFAKYDPASVPEGRRYEDDIMYSKQITETPEFKSWFRLSKIVDENGNPLIVYHGTKRDFSEFKAKYSDGLLFFTINPEFAGKWPRGTGGLREPSAETKQWIEKVRETQQRIYKRHIKSHDSYDFNTPEGEARYAADKAKVDAEMLKETGVRSWVEAESNSDIRIMPVYLSIQKPFDPRTDYALIEPTLMSMPNGMDEMVRLGHHKRGSWIVYENKTVIDALKEMGYDGIWLAENTDGPHETIAAFSPNQVKSATGNRGTFDPANDDIMYAKRLDGMPESYDVDGQSIEFGYYEPARDAARLYMEKTGREYVPLDKYAEVNRGRAERIAKEYDAMKHNPEDPEVRAAYEAMAEETLEQYRAILHAGLQVEFIRGDDPYSNPRNVILDVINNNHMYVFSTRDGYGSDAATTIAQQQKTNPLLRDSGFKDINGTPMLVNDVFRVVHDYFGHIQNGVGFRARGEENAWQSHASMYSPLARRAMTSETRGQNSWVNYGPSGAVNQKASPYDTIYAEQKIGLLPVWVSEEGRLSDTVRRGDERYRAGLEGAIKADGRLTLNHYSGQQLTRIDPAYAGTGADRSAKGRATYPRVSYYGIAEAAENPYSKESVVAPLKAYDHKVTIAPELVYPADLDPEGLWYGANKDDLYQRIKDAGYSGFWSNHPTLGKVAVLWDPMQVEEAGPFGQVSENPAPKRQPQAEIPEAEIDRVVTENKSREALGPARGVPRFSSAADPRSQYVAQHPEVVKKDAGDFDINYAMRVEYATPEGKAAVERVIGHEVRRGDPYNIYDLAEDSLYKPSKVRYLLSKAKQEAIFRFGRFEWLSANSPLRENLADTSAMASLLQLSRAMGIMSAALRYGPPAYVGGRFIALHKPVLGKLGIEVPGVDWTRVKSLIDIHGQLVTQEYGNLESVAKAYAIAQRGKRLDEEGIPVPLDKKGRDDIEREVLHYVDPATNENIIKRWYADWQYYNEQVIKMGFDSGILTEETAKQWREQADYFPFYRVAEGAGGKIKKLGENVFGGITGAVSLRELKGGETPINMPMVDATVMNVSAMIQMSMKNVAQQRVVRDMLSLGLAKMLKPGEDAKSAGKGKAYVTEFRVNGKKARAEIYDPLVFESLEPLDGTDVVSNIRKTAGLPATALRELITRDPGFIFLTNLMRDSLSSYVTSGAKLTPLVSTVKGMFGGIETLEALGVAGGYDLSNEGDGIRDFYGKQLKKRGIGEGGKYDGLNLFQRMWDGLGHLTTLSDAASRNAVFEDVYQRTGNFAEAAHQAQEVINFGRHGRHPWVRILTAVIPFLNARLQGLDVFNRALSGQYTADMTLSRSQAIGRAVWRGSLMMGATLAYYLLVSDDDQYKLAPDYVKDNYWVFPTDSGVPVLLPIPFEVGLLFKTIPETILARTLNDNLDRDFRSRDEVGQTIKRSLWSTLELHPYQIQFFGPIMEAVTNFDPFTGRPIVSQYLMDGREPGAQSEAYTNQIARIIGESLNISPMRVEHALEGYGGTLGVYLLDVMDMVARSELVQGDNRRAMPSRPWYDYPIIRRVFGKAEDRGLVHDAYELDRVIKTAYGTYMDMMKDGRGEEAMAYIQSRQDLLGMRGGMNKIRQKMDELRRYREQVMRSDLPADEKRQQIEELDAYLNGMLRTVIPTMERQLDLPFWSPMYSDSPTASQLGR